MTEKIPKDFEKKIADVRTLEGVLAKLDNTETPLGQRVDAINKDALGILLKDIPEDAPTRAQDIASLTQKVQTASVESPETYNLVRTAINSRYGELGEVYKKNTDTILKPIVQAAATSVNQAKNKREAVLALSAYLGAIVQQDKKVQQELAKAQSSPGSLQRARLQQYLRADPGYMDSDAQAEASFIVEKALADYIKVSKTPEGKTNYSLDTDKFKKAMSSDPSYTVKVYADVKKAEAASKKKAA